MQSELHHRADKKKPASRPIPDHCSHHSMAGAALGRAGKPQRLFKLYPLWYLQRPSQQQPGGYLPKSFPGTTTICGNHCQSLHGNQTEGTKYSHVKHVPVMS